MSGLGNSNSNTINSSSSSGRICRNVIIHGWCKYEKQGCAFHHPRNEEPPSTADKSQKSLSVNAPLFIPSSNNNAVSAETVQQQILFMEMPNVVSPTSLASNMSRLTPLQHHLYLSFKSEESPVKDEQHISKLFLSEKLRRRLVETNEDLYGMMASVTNHQITINNYHSIIYVEDLSLKDSKYLKRPIKTYRALSKHGCSCLLRRIENFTILDDNVISAFEIWSRVNSPYIVRLKEIFTTKAFHDDSVVFVYEYSAGFVQLSDIHMSLLAKRSSSGPLYTEDELWSLSCQIISALKSLHDNGLSCHIITLDSMICCDSKYKLDYIGLVNLINTQNNEVHAQDDLLNFGKVLLELSSIQFNNLNNSENSFHSYSNDFLYLIRYLLSQPSPSKTIDDLIYKLGPRFLKMANSFREEISFLEEELSKELENGRLFRLLCQLGFVNERPEYDMEPQWSETGDRYVLKLFRDYVFHQVDSAGKPVIDFGHIIQNLNRLDTGTPDRIMLTSRDDRSCLVVSFSDLKKCLQNAIKDLKNRKS